MLLYVIKVFRMMAQLSRRETSSILYGYIKQKNINVIGSNMDRTPILTTRSQTK